jgi:hypothetical protein
MGKGGANTASIEIDHSALPTTGKDNAPAKCVAALVIDQPDLQEQFQRIAQAGQMPPQITSGGIADAQQLDQIGVEQAPLGQVVNSLGVAVELKLVKRGSLLQQFGRWGRNLAQFRLQVFYALAEGKA